MRLVVLTCLTLIAFAANSILNRLAVDSGAIGPGAFAAVRVGAGAVTLWALVRLRGRALPLFAAGRWQGALALSVYMLGFSMAYRALDAGLGALILFGVVQVSMFAWTALRGAPATRRQMIGAAVAFSGLIVVLWPGGGTSVDLVAAALMVAAGIGWAGYTLLGRREPDALAATAANFVAAFAPVAIVGLVPELVAGAGAPNAAGLGLAVLSGAVTSGLGYATWYTVLPRLETGVAAVLQSSVPVIALAGGVALLGEAMSLQLLAGAVLVLGGIGMAIRG
ncbi:DMT family transporter [Marinibacterium profundimaris]|uniref:Membrane protein n=1 Tax=Marinibacterium profundimaris TaxID=1679460 RepID=A0A225NE53_9RHOB|nr:DMT family transporter [Marinibacterium profundimaris]OWU68753.1 membrane protein [Marinibacterium profundimaris]